MTRDCLGERVEVGDVVRLFGATHHSDHALVEAELPGGDLMVRRFDKARSAWHATWQRWGASRVRRDPDRGCRAAGQRNNPVFRRPPAGVVRLVKHRCGYFIGQKVPPGCVVLLRDAAALTVALEQARRECGAFMRLSGETLVQMDRAIERGRVWSLPVDAAPEVA